jgi:Amt family ammonium transporter|tara:strand:+ start:4 stop:1224 length:1221 start_codon:yes stop_codon:yes gene_type:complete
METQDIEFIFNTFSFLVNGILVMLMAAGFCMLEAGMVRTKSVATICTKNIALYSIAGVLYFLLGYNLMYSGVDGGFIGSFSLFDVADPSTETSEGGYAGASDWFFQMVFVATAASIVSGAVAERVKLWPFMVVVVVLTAIIYPIQGSWTWGAGWLSEIGFSDFAGSTIVHSVGGWCALVGCLIVGARKGKYSEDGKVNPMPASALPLATLGTFLLWFGWFGFNGGSQLALGSVADASAMARIFCNTNLAAAGGVIVAMILSQLLYKKVDLTFVLNGALGGLVSITAEPLTPTFLSAMLIGGTGGALVMLAVPLLDKLKIDDVVGAIPVHLVCGIWGTLAVPLTNSNAKFSTQLIGIISIGAFVLITSFILWFTVKAVLGIRLSEEEEKDGSDKTEIGLRSYPEFIS